jgi:ribosome assembly protein YihI (activator of Der GTPase)
MIHGAELSVHFLKSFQKKSTCENLSQKGLKSKKKKKKRRASHAGAQTRNLGIVGGNN